MAKLSIVLNNSHVFERSYPVYMFFTSQKATILRGLGIVFVLHPLRKFVVFNLESVGVLRVNSLVISN